jgi:hypothetical protein
MLHEQKWRAKFALAISAFAALRVFLFAAAFPLFNNTDERFHFVTIEVYARGQLPGKELPLIGESLAKTIAPYASFEYWQTEFRNDYASRLQTLAQWRNFEAQGPPLYYVIAAAWYKFGAFFGLQDARLAYWVRFINPLSYGLLVWLSYCFVRRVYPENMFLSVAVPALIAVFPQDVFFGMNRDVISPTLWAGALLLMVDTIEDKPTSYRSLLFASLLVGFGFLLELSNFVLYVAWMGTLWCWLRRSQTSARYKSWVTGLSAIAAFVPPLLWMGRNYLVMGNLTGAQAKIRYLGWTMKPLSEVFHHPLFSFHGLEFFLRWVTFTFWCGEYRWHGLLMQSVVADWFYFLSTAVFLFIFVLDFAYRRTVFSSLQKWVAWQTLFAVAGSIFFLSAVSVAFDYHDSGYPSQALPFFVSGRIISGVLLPFMLMYAGGLEAITKRVRRWISPTVVLACLLLLITASEIRVRRAVFSSPYNFFSLESGRSSLFADGTLPTNK